MAEQEVARYTIVFTGDTKQVEAAAARVKQVSEQAVTQTTATVQQEAAKTEAVVTETAQRTEVQVETSANRAAGSVARATTRAEGSVVSFGASVGRSAAKASQALGGVAAAVGVVATAMEKGREVAESWANYLDPEVSIGKFYEKIKDLDPKAQLKAVEDRVKLINDELAKQQNIDRDNGQESARTRSLKYQKEFFERDELSRGKQRDAAQTLIDIQEEAARQDSLLPQIEESMAALERLREINRLYEDEAFAETMRKIREEESERMASARRVFEASQRFARQLATEQQRIFDAFRQTSDQSISSIEVSVNRLVELVKELGDYPIVR